MASFVPQYVGITPDVYGNYIDAMGVVELPGGPNVTAEIPAQPAANLFASVPVWGWLAIAGGVLLVLSTLEK